jgi:hypothetical protein
MWSGVVGREIASTQAAPAALVTSVTLRAVAAAL